MRGTECKGGGNKIETRIKDGRETNIKKENIEKVTKRNKEKLHLIRRRKRKRTMQIEDPATSCCVVGALMGPIYGNLELPHEQEVTAGDIFWEKKDSNA